MSVSDRVRTAVKASAALEKQSEDLKRLVALYESLKDQGIIVSRSYNLPQTDTVGRGFYEGQGRIQTILPSNYPLG